MELVVYLKKGIVSVAIATTAMLSGCASFTSHQENDPFEYVNRGVHSFNETADEYVLEPAAKGYQYITPVVVDEAISHFFSNLDDVKVVINDVLQLKFNQALSDGGRLFVNTTIGVLGFIDIATDMGMSKHHEDFGQTLGAYGIGTGPYIVLPILGSSTLRDTVGLYGDMFANPTQQINDSDTRWGVIALKGIDTRADLISTKNLVDKVSIDLYEFYRSVYFQRREYVVYDGNPPLDEEDEDFLDEE